MFVQLRVLPSFNNGILNTVGLLPEKYHERCIQRTHSAVPPAAVPSKFVHYRMAQRVWRL